MGIARTGLGIAARGYAAFQAPEQDKARQSWLGRLAILELTALMEAQMRIGSVILVLWLVIGGFAAGQRGDYKGSLGNCSRASTIAVTVLAGPLNYAGVNPNINCTVPRPSS